MGTGIIEYDGEDFASKGKLMLFQPRKVKSKAGKTSPIELVKRSEKDITIGPITYLASLQSEDIYRVVVGAGAEVTVEQWGSKKLSIDSNERQLSQVGFYHAHMQVRALAMSLSLITLNLSPSQSKSQPGPSTDDIQNILSSFRRVRNREFS